MDNVRTVVLLNYIFEIEFSIKQDKYIKECNKMNKKGGHSQLLHCMLCIYLIFLNKKLRFKFENLPFMKDGKKFIFFLVFSSLQICNHYQKRSHYFAL